MVLSKLTTELYSVHHLTQEDTSAIKTFRIDNPKGKGLELYLQEMAIEEENNNNARTYLVKDLLSKEIVVYFTLKTGLITKKQVCFISIILPE